MPIYKMRNLGKYGVITDIPAYDLPDEGWSMANNIRFRANSFEKMKGFAPTLGPAPDGGNVLCFTQEPETEFMLYGTEKNLYRYDATGSSNISLTAGAYSAEPAISWDYTVLSNVTVFNNAKNAPQAWIKGNAAHKVQNLPGWGKHTTSQATASEWRCQKMRAYKNYLVALNTVEDSGGNGTGAMINYPQRVRWSDVAYLNSLPSNWNDDGVGTSAGTASDGGFNDLSDCNGIILDGRPMRDSFMIYTNRETYVMDFVGGDLMFTFRKLFPDSGLISPNCVCEFEGYQHFVVSENDIFIHDGSTKKSVATDIVKEYLLGGITGTNYKATKVFPYPSRKEIWVTYTSMSGEVAGLDNYASNKVAIWNWQTGQWTFSDLPNLFWMEALISPSVDARQWSNPSSSKFVSPTSLVLDSPIYRLPVGKSFRLDALYKIGEGLTTNDRLMWSANNAGIDVSDVNQLDWSCNIKGVTAGTTVLTMTLGKYDPVTGATTPTAIKDSYTIEVSAANTEIGYRHMDSDPDKNSDPLEPKPPTGSFRPQNAADPDNTWGQPDPTDPTKEDPKHPHYYETWEQRGFSFSRQTLMGSSADTSFYMMDYGTTQNLFMGIDNTGSFILDTQPVISEISKFGISMTNVEDSLGRHKTWRTIYPLMAGEGTVRFSIGGSDDAFTSPIFTSTIDYDVGLDYKVDCFVNNKFLALKIRDEGEGEWSLSGFDIDYFLGGLR